LPIADFQFPIERAKAGNISRKGLGIQEIGRVDYATGVTVADQTELAKECYRCGYDLRGIANDQACPECGLLARRSRRVSDELHETRPRWLRRLTWGVRLILLTILLCGGWPVIFGMLKACFERFGPSTLIWRLFWQHFPFIGLETLALLFFSGVFLLTTREGYAPADRADARFRRFVRRAALVPLLALVLTHIQSTLDQTSGNYRKDWSALEIAAILLATIGCIPLPLLLFYQLRNLAKRARSAHLAEHCAIVGIGTSLSLLYLAVLLLVFQIAKSLGLGTYWTSTSPISLLMMLIMITAAGLFLLWSLYLLIRFSIAFSRAKRQLREKWKRHDRAVT
jgi:hypothetical protein